MKPNTNYKKTVGESSSRPHLGPNKAAEPDYHVLLRGNNVNKTITKVTVSSPGVKQNEVDLGPRRPQPDHFGNPMAPHPPNPIDKNDMDIVSSSKDDANDNLVNEGINDI